MSETTASIYLLVATAAVVFLIILIKGGYLTKRGESGISAQDVAAVGVYGLFKGLLFLAGITQKISLKIWRSRFRWVWVVIISIYVSYYGIKGYNRFFTDEAPGLKPTSTVITDKLVFVFTPPPGAEPPYRAEIVDHFLVETAKNDRVVFDFGRGAMKVYTLAGQKSIYRGLSKATRAMSGIPFHGEESLEGPVYKGSKIDKISPPGKGFIVGGTEIEWPDLPCVLKVRTEKGNPMKLITDKVKFRFIPQNTLGSVPKQ